MVTALEAEDVPVATSCRVLKLSRSSYYRRRKPQPLSCSKVNRDLRDSPLTEKILDIAGKHPAWGYRRITAYLLRKCGFHINHKRVRRIMCEQDIRVPRKCYKAKRAVTRDKPKAERKNQWWGTDMTKFYVQYVGWVYVVVVLDWFTKRALGHSIGTRPITDLWLEALNKAVVVACPAGSRSYALHLMTDNGSQPTSNKYENVLETLGIEHVTTSFNNPKGNADTERFMRTFKEEVVWPCEYESLGETLTAVDTFFDFYNRDYPHSTLGGMSPIDFEATLNHNGELLIAQAA